MFVLGYVSTRQYTSAENPGHFSSCVCICFVIAYVVNGFFFYLLSLELSSLVIIIANCMKCLLHTPGGSRKSNNEAYLPYNRQSSFLQKL